MLRIGKIKESVYERSVEKQLHNEKKAVAPFLVRTISLEGWTLAAERVVYNMINTFAVSCSSVSQITVSVTMPEATEEPVFRKFVADLGRLCAERSIWITVGDAKVLKEVQIPLITAVGVGSGIDQKKKKLAPDMDIVVAGTIACEGAAVLARKYRKQLSERFATFYIETAEQLFDAAAMPAVLDILAKQEASGTAVREGGIFAGLWQLAAAGKVGLDIDLTAIPIRQHTVEICEYFSLNPYMLLSGGCLLIAAHRGDSVVSALKKEGIAATVIGATTSGNDRIIRYDDEIRYLEPPKTDEIYRLKED